MGKDRNGKELGSGIRQRKDGTYEARYVDQFGKRRSIYNVDLRMLKKNLIDVEEEVKKNAGIADPNITLDKWYDRWMLTYKHETVRENTIRHYNHIYRKHISPVLGRFKLTEITHLQIQMLINNLKQSGLGWETQNKSKILLVDMFNHALIDDLVLKNPALGIRIASQKPDSDRKVLSVEEQLLFFECCAGTWYDNLFQVALNTGLRPGELFALTPDNIDFKNKEISVEHTLVYQKFDSDTCKTFHLDPPKTERSKRKVPINETCEKYLKKQIVQKNIVAQRYPNNTEWSKQLFVTRKNTPLNAQIYSDAIHSIIYEINSMRDTFEQIDLFSGHTFRHTFATRCFEANIPPKTVQTLLGHASIQMTMDLYVHESNDHKRNAIDQLDDSLSQLAMDDDVINERYKNCTQKVVLFSAS